MEHIKNSMAPDTTIAQSPPQMAIIGLPRLKKTIFSAAADIPKIKAIANVK